MVRRILYAAAAVLATGTIFVGGLRGGRPLQGVRGLAVSLVRSRVPFDRGDSSYAVVCKDYGGIGTTCGYLPHWMLWAVGCRLRRVVNRYEPKDGLAYRDGANISALRWQPEFVAYNRLAASTLPLPGDIFFVSDGPPATEHVGVVLGISEDGVWTCAEAGQEGGGARIVRRILIDGRLARLAAGSDVEPDRSFHARKLVGWLDLDRVMAASDAA